MLIITNPLLSRKIPSLLVTSNFVYKKEKVTFMKKMVKNFGMAMIGALLFFIVSFIVQYYFSVWTSITIVMALAALNGIIGFVVMIGILYLKPDCKKHSILILTLKWIAMLLAFSFLMFLSTIGNVTLNNLTLIGFIVVIALSMIWILYFSIKVLLEEYKKYKENQ